MSETLNPEEETKFTNPVEEKAEQDQALREEVVEAAMMEGRNVEHLTESTEADPEATKWLKAKSSVEKKFYRDSLHGNPELQSGKEG
jgi:hypothetical protein